jgi:hypothetical protein
MPPLLGAPGGDISGMSAPQKADPWQAPASCCRGCWRQLHATYVAGHDDTLSRNKYDGQPCAAAAATCCLLQRTAALHPRARKGFARSCKMQTPPQSSARNIHARGACCAGPARTNVQRSTATWPKQGHQRSSHACITALPPMHVRWHRQN